MSWVAYKKCKCFLNLTNYLPYRLNAFAWYNRLLRLSCIPSLISGGIAAGFISDQTGCSGITCVVMLVLASPSVSIRKHKNFYLWSALLCVQPFFDRTAGLGSCCPKIVVSVA